LRYQWYPDLSQPLKASLWIIMQEFNLAMKQEASKMVYFLHKWGLHKARNVEKTKLIFLRMNWTFKSFTKKLNARKIIFILSYLVSGHLFPILHLLLLLCLARMLIKTKKLAIRTQKYKKNFFKKLTFNSYISNLISIV